MLDLLTTDEFARWFAALDEAPAEDVAATLEVIVQLGTRTEAPGSSEWLLWYEDPSLSQRFPALAGASPTLMPGLQRSPELVKFAQDWGAFYGYVKRVVKHLESPAFVARLANLTPGAATAVAAAVAKIRRASTTRSLALAEFQMRGQPRLSRIVGPPSAADAAAFARFADISEIRQSYFAALEAAGFEIADVPAHSPALREVSLRSAAPGLRLLYGIDESRNRGLVVLGEWLDRSFYGDSVRLAEARWKQFLDGSTVATQPAVAR